MIPIVRGRLVTTAEAAETLGISQGTLRRWCKSPAPPIPYRVVGEGYRFDTADIDDYLAAGYVAAGRSA